MYESARPEDKNEAALWIVAVYNALADYDKGQEWTRKLDGTPIEERLHARAE